MWLSANEKKIQEKGKKQKQAVEVYLTKTAFECCSSYCDSVLSSSGIHRPQLTIEPLCSLHDRNKNIEIFITRLLSPLQYGISDVHILTI
jgi:hypothetical protein